MLLKALCFLIFLVVIESTITDWADDEGDRSGEVNGVNPLTFGFESISEPFAQSCAEVPIHRSGIHRIQPQYGFNNHFLAFCDQNYSQGGWTVIQNRFDGSVNFYRGWSEYENGFGDLRGEFWLGLKRIHELTYARKHELHILLEDFNGTTVSAKYNDFSVAGPAEKYMVKSVGSFSGDAGDSFSNVVNQYFSTMDADNDSNGYSHCAAEYKGGWWYETCHESNLNGLYLPGENNEYATMLCWKSFRGYHYGLQRSRMMIRPVN